MIAVFSFGFNLTGFTIQENFFVETEKIFNNPQSLILIILNVLLAMLIAYGMNHVNKNLSFFLDSPFEKILPSLGTPQPKIFFRTALKSYITKTRYTFLSYLFKTNKIKKTYKSHKEIL